MRFPDWAGRTPKPHDGQPAADQDGDETDWKTARAKRVSRL